MEINLECMDKLMAMAKKDGVLALGGYHLPVYMVTDMFTDLFSAHINILLLAGLAYEAVTLAHLEERTVKHMGYSTIDSGLDKEVIYISPKRASRVINDVVKKLYI
jgi:hypothetical protein